MIYLTLITALAIAATAAWYSIIGLMAIFAGAVIPIAIMGGVLEVGKLVTAAWLHQNWDKMRWWMKTYLTSSVIVLMFITSLGIFGFLSKAHLEHSIATGGTNELQITQLERQLAREQSKITDAERVLDQLDKAVETLISYDRIRGRGGSIAVRESQREERQGLNDQIEDAYEWMEVLQTKLTPLQQEKLAIEVEVGPLKYIAELMYGDNSEDYFDEAVRFVILLLIFTFDPLAIVLLLAATQGFTERKRSKIFHDDGTMRVDPSNVVDVEGDLADFEEWGDNPIGDWPDRDQPNTVKVNLEDYQIVEDAIPDDEEFEVATGVNIEEEIDIIPKESERERERRLEKYLYGEDVRGVPKIGIKEVYDE